MSDQPPHAPELSWRNPPVFVVGCGHSGTSLAARIVGAHSAIAAIPGETNAAWKRDPDAFREKLRGFDAFAAERHCDRWVEKTPRHVRCIDFILEQTPDCRIVCMLRDPRDVCFSLLKRHGDLRKAINRWRSDNTSLLPYLQHSRCHFVRYEDLVSAPGKVTASVMAFIGESYEEQQLQFHLQKVQWYAATSERPASEYGQANHDQLRNWQINQPIFDGRQKWKEGLGSDELALIRSGVNRLAATLGYDLDWWPLHRATRRFSGRFGIFRRRGSTERP